MILISGKLKLLGWGEVWVGESSDIVLLVAMDTAVFVLVAGRHGLWLSPTVLAATTTGITVKVYQPKPKRKNYQISRTPGR